MRFGEPHSFPERESPTKLRASGQQSSKGDRVEYIYIYIYIQVACSQLRIPQY